MQDDQTTNAGEDETEDLEHEEAEQEEQEEQEEHEEEAEGEEEDSDLAKAPTDPAPPKPLSELAQRVFRSLPDAYTVEEEWATTEGIQGVLNAQPGAEFLAVQVVDGALAELFNRNLVDKLGGPPDKWRESDSVVVARVARVIAELHQGPISMESLEGDPRESEALDLLVDAGLVAIADGKAAFAAGDSPHELRIDIHVATSVVEASRAVEAPATRIDAGEAKLLIQEIAACAKAREREATRATISRRGSGVAPASQRAGRARRGARRHRRREEQSRGVRVHAKPHRRRGREGRHLRRGPRARERRSPPIRSTSRRATSPTARRGSRVSTAQIRDLKNAAACNQRVVATAPIDARLERKAVITYAVDDHRVLAEEDLPHGTQRTIEERPGRRFPRTEAAARRSSSSSRRHRRAARRLRRSREREGVEDLLDLTKKGGERVTEIEEPERRATRTARDAALLPLSRSERLHNQRASRDGARSRLPTDEAGLALSLR
jgi:hypothetical protein